jgi:hypothetical protein
VSRVCLLAGCPRLTHRLTASCVRAPDEFWLAVEAKKRNPAIRLYGLPWGWPGWVGGSSGHPLAPDNAVATAHYIADWVECAKTAHNLTIDFVGPWCVDASPCMPHHTSR